MQLIVNCEGAIRCLYDEAVDLSSLGSLTIQRGSHVEPDPTGRWLADLYELARQQLRGLGISAIYGGEFCTFSEPERFFSYRRESRTGRMASLIWLE